MRIRMVIRFDPYWVRQHSFVDIDHEIFSIVILSLPLIQEGQLSLCGERMCIRMLSRSLPWKKCGYIINVN